MIDLRGYFTESEFKCKCGQCDKGYPDMEPVVISRLVDARHLAKVSFILTSAMRCVERNRVEGGSDTSSHLTGWAVDIKATSSATRFYIVRALLLAGFTRIGIAKTFIHADCDPGKTPEVAWLY